MKLFACKILTLWLTLSISACYPYGNPFSIAPNKYYCGELDGGYLKLQADGHVELNLKTETIRIVKRGQWSPAARRQIKMVFTQESHYQLINKAADLYEKEPSLTLSIQVSVTADIVYFEDSHAQIQALKVFSTSQDSGCLQQNYQLARILPI